MDWAGLWCRDTHSDIVSESPFLIFHALLDCFQVKCDRKGRGRDSESDRHTAKSQAEAGGFESLKLIWRRCTPPHTHTDL